MLEWIGKHEDEKIKKLITKEKNFWSDQLRKANAVDGIWVWVRRCEIFSDRKGSALD